MKFVVGETYKGAKLNNNAPVGLVVLSSSTNRYIMKMSDTYAGWAGHDNELKSEAHRFYLTPDVTFKVVLLPPEPVKVKARVAVGSVITREQAAELPVGSIVSMYYEPWNGRWNVITMPNGTYSGIKVQGKLVGHVVKPKNWSTLNHNCKLTVLYINEVTK